MVAKRRSVLAPRFPFKNLVFQGGGVKAYVYHGALRVLDEYDILPQIERVAGTSAGALQATVLSFRLGIEETIDLYKTVDHAKIRSQRNADDDEGRAGILASGLKQVQGDLESVNRFLRRYGYYSNSYVKTWLDEAIAAQCDGNGRATFAEFRDRGFRDLYTVAANLTQQRLEVFAADTTPEVAVADAVLMSGSVPFFFEAVRFDGERLGRGDYYMDGGVLSNYPLTIFDDPRFEEASRHFVAGVNWETLGCQMFTPEDRSRRGSEITNIVGYAASVVESLGNMQNVAVEMRTVDSWRSISISNCGVSSLDFDIQPTDSDPRYVELVRSGEQATREYLDNYRLPTDRLAELKERLSNALGIGLAQWD